MAVISGIGGYVDTAISGVRSIRKWSIDDNSADAPRVVASNTKGGSTRVAGNLDWSGQYQAFGHTPAVMPGDSFTFKGSIDGTKGVSGAALCDSIEVTVDIEGGQVISHVARFSANGALAKGNVSATADTSVPNEPSSIGCKVQTADPSASPAFADLADVRQYTLTITADNQSYVSSETAGQTQRKKGNYDFQVSISRYTSDFADGPQPNNVKHLKLFVNATEFWELKWARFIEDSGLEVDREGAGLVACTKNAVMEGFTLVGSTPTAGHIKKPDTTTWWS
jgi:hypothetical protein